MGAPWLLVGWMRFTMVLVFIASAGWTIFRAVLNVAPNAAANYLMNTSQLDNGEFWQLRDPDQHILIASVAGLSLVGAIYVYLTVVLLLPAATVEYGDVHRRVKTKTTETSPKITEIPLKSIGIRSIWASSGLEQLHVFYHELVDLRGKYRKAWNVVMEIPELTFQTITLHDMLSNGLKPRLVGWYVALMVVNCVYSFYHITIAWRHHAFNEMVGDAMLDVVFAVVFPALTLQQTISDFRGGLGSILIREKFLPAQPYERRSRLYADPRQINLFTTAFETLQITSIADVVVTVGFNLLTCLRWRRIVKTLRRKRVRTRSSLIKANSIVPLSAPVSATAAAKNGDHPRSHIGPKTRVVPAYVGVLFLIYGVVVAVYTSMAISASQDACKVLIHCFLWAHQWFPGAPEMACPCLVFIEGNLMERRNTDEELVDASAELSLAAEAGSLRTIQIVYRALQGKLPRCVRGCTELRHLIIVYSDLTELPTGWSATFTKLSYVHMTGRTGAGNLVSIPVDFFCDMPSLRLLHLEGHPSLSELPSFASSSPLELLFISDLPSLTSLPAFSNTPKLKTLAVMKMGKLAWLPDLTPLAKSLQHVSIVAAPLCCSGFLTQGRCNELYPTCWAFIPSDNEDSCYPSETDVLNNASLAVGTTRFPLVSDSSRAVLQPFLDSDAACNKSAVKTHSASSRMDVCGGKWYRKCPNGICYSFTDARTTCMKDQALISMRMMEISYGFVCDPAEEAWLGCS